MRTLLSIFLIIVILLVAAAGGAWWYLYGGNKMPSDELVPGDTVFFATIPNAMEIVTQYQTSKLQTLVNDPNIQPLTDKVHSLLGDKNLDLLNSLLPSLSGQSFIAVTHFDSDHPEKTGFIAAMKPKPGLGNFNAFIDKWKADYPDMFKKVQTGQGSVAGVDYQWMQDDGQPDKICVAQVGGWIVTTWGEAPLQDWAERYYGKPSTPSLAQNSDYQKSVQRVGKDSLTLVYLDCHVFVDLLKKQIAKTNPAVSDFAAKKWGVLGSAAIGTRFENGEIADHFSVLIPRQAQIDSGINTSPCAFDTLKFTGPNTRFYWAASINPQQYWKNIQEQEARMGQTMTNPSVLTNALQSWAQSAGLDFQKNIIDPLGSEFSIQAEWNPDSLYPEVGLFVKLDKPDDFKPTIQAIIEGVRKKYATSAVINEIRSPTGHNFASLKFVTQAIPISPTITEDGDYFGLFMTDNLAARSFQRDEPGELPHNVDFVRQIGDKRNGASQLLFLDTPQLLDRAYRTALPYVSMAAMFNQTLASAIKGHDLPPDLTWLAPISTWSFVVSADDDGFAGYSTSGIGNQGIFLAGAVGGTVSTLQMMGIIPQPSRIFQPTPPALPPPPATTGSTTPPPTLDATTNAAPPVTSDTTSATSSNMGPGSATPDASAATNSSTSPGTPGPDASTNAIPSALSNSNANPAPPAPTQSQ